MSEVKKESYLNCPYAYIYIAEHFYNMEFRELKSLINLAIQFDDIKKVEEKINKIFDEVEKHKKEYKELENIKNGGKKDWLMNLI